MKNIAFIFFYSLLAQISFSQPFVSSISPASGPAGTNVIITGANFSPIAADNIVYFGAVKAVVSSASAAALTVIAPAGATLQPVTVTVNGLTGFSPYSFTLTFPDGGAMDQGSFANKIDFTTDLHPNDIALADLDGDGKSDVVTANNYSTAGTPASISILRNTSVGGSITFAVKQDISNGVATYAVAVGDLDGDGKQDVVASSIGEQNISVFRNTSTTGVISFAAKIDFSGASSPYDIAIGDVDGDGKPDIAVVNASGNTISIFKNTGTIGNISFAPKVDFITALNPQRLVLADFDGDRKSDIAVTNKFSYSFSTFRNTSSAGNISFATRADQTCGTGNQPTGITVGDFNDDNKPDLVVIISRDGNGDAGFGQSFKNNSTVGNIGFTNLTGIAATQYSTAYQVAAGDLNGDGKPDLALASTAAGKINIYQNAVTSSLWTFGGSVGKFNANSPYAVAIGDLDGDSKPEIISTDFIGEKIAIFKNNCGLPYISSFSPDSGPSGTVVSILGSNFSGATAVTFGNVPATSFTVVNSTKINATVNNGATGNVVVTTPQGMGSLGSFTYFGPPVITSFTPANAGVGQTITITGSFVGTLSAVSFGGVPATSFTLVSPTTIIAMVAAGATGDVSVTTTYGTTVKPGFTFFIPPVVSAFSPAKGFTGTIVNITGSNFTGSTAVSFGGINAQSFTVVSATNITAVVGEGATGSVYVTTPGGTDSMNLFQFDPPVITSFVPASGHAGTTVTIYGNNFSTIAANNIVYFGAARAIVTAAGVGILTVQVPTGTTNDPITVTTHGATAYSQRSFIMTFDGGSPSTAPVSFNWKGGFVTGDGPERIISADLDGDGKVDCIVSNSQDGNVVALRNTGTNNNISFAPAVDISGTYYRFCETATADFNSDGKLDVVLASFYSGVLRIFLNTSTAGSISFAPYINLPLVNFNPRKILIGDFDGDAKPDVGVCDVDIYNNNNAFCIFRNTGINGKASFVRKVINYYAIDVTNNMFAADFNQDNKIDLIISSGSNQISTQILPNTSTVGNINFGAPVTVNATNGKVLAVCDFNNDNLPDLILSNTLDDKVFSLSRNTSTAGTFKFADKVSFNTGYSINTIVPGELSGDTKPDIVVNNYSVKSVAVYKNNSTASNLSMEPGVKFFSQLTYDWPSHVSIADIDGDGKTDIVACHASDDRISVFRNGVNVSTQIKLCPLSNATIVSGMAGSSFQWKLNTGNGFVDISDGANYAGTNTSTLQLTAVPSFYYGYQFICVANTGNSDEFSLQFANVWNGSINNDWANPANWSCGSVPDNYTDVIINAGVVIINSNTTIRSLTLNPGASLTVTPGIALTMLY